MWGVAFALTRRGESHEPEGWLVVRESGGASASEAIGRFAMGVFAMPMALVMGMRKAV